MKKKDGFTLIEIISVLVLLGFLGIGIGAIFMGTFKGYVLTRNRTETADNVQIALSRITLEIQSASADWIYSETTTNTIKFLNSNLLQERGIRSQNNTITLISQTNTDLYHPSAKEAEHVLLPNSSMSISYIDTAGDSHTTWIKGAPKLKLIQITLTVPGSELDNSSLTFSTQILPRG